VAAATELAVSGSELAAGLDLLHVWAGADSCEELDSCGGLGNGESGGVNDERNLGDGADVVTAGEEEGGDGRCGKGRGSGEALLAQVDLLVPLAPDLGGCEHATGTAHVTEGGLTSAVSTTTRDTRNTGDSATCVGETVLALCHFARVLLPSEIFSLSLSTFFCHETPPIRAQ